MFGLNPLLLPVTMEILQKRIMSFTSYFLIFSCMLRNMILKIRYGDKMIFSIRRARIGTGFQVTEFSAIGGQVVLGEDVYVEKDVWIKGSAQVNVGNRTIVGRRVVIGCYEKVSIGKDVLIAENVSI